MASSGDRGFLSRGLAIALLGLVVAVAFAYPVLRPADKEIRCAAIKQVEQVDGRSLVLEDRGLPGPDDCDSSTTAGEAEFPRLGYDCKIRDVHRHVIATASPNRHDGTCGQADR
jgi:hypothetical protein